MAISFPVDLKNYLAGYGQIRPMRRRMDTTDNRTYGESAGGAIYINSFGTELWHGQVVVTPLHHALMRPLEARVRALKRSDAEFFIGDLMDDPAPGNPGTPLIDTVVASTGQLRIKGLSANYRIPAGLKLSWRYGTRYALHETVETVNANSTGVATVEVYPAIEPGWATDAPILLASAAYCKAVILPGTFTPGEADANITQGWSFTWRQTLR